jgi:hypothetical protein
MMDVPRRNIWRITNEDMPVWRIFDPEHVVALFRDKELVLVKPERWEDRFENWLSTLSFRYNGGVLSSATLVNNFYCSCWSEDGTETEAVWRLNAPKEKRGIRVRSTVRKLLDLVYDPHDPITAIGCHIGRMQYMSDSEIDTLIADHATLHALVFDTTGRGQAETLFMKREAFSHEREVRLVYREWDNAKLVDPLCRIRVPNPNRLVDGLTLDPRMMPDEGEQWRKALAAVGCSIPVEHSSFYRAPITIDLEI